MSTSGKTAQDVAITAAKIAADIILRDVERAKHLTYKGRRDIATDTDIAAEKAIIELLCQEFPDHSLLAEESGRRDQHNPYQWIIDPLDGTTNFSQGIPSFCVSIALAYHEEIVLGVIKEPLRKELFVAIKGRGALLNGSHISVSTKVDLGSAVVGFDLGYDEVSRQLSMHSAVTLLPIARTLRLIGSAALALAYTAAGRLDAFYQHRLYPWDWAAGSLMVSEAGGEITNSKGGPIDLDTSSIIAANRSLHAQLLETLRPSSEAHAGVAMGGLS